MVMNLLRDKEAGDKPGTARTPPAKHRMFDVFAKEKALAQSLGADADDAGGESIEQMIQSIKAAKAKKNQKNQGRSMSSGDGGGGGRESGRLTAVPENEQVKSPTSSPPASPTPADSDSDSEDGEKAKKLPPWKRNKYAPDLNGIDEEELWDEDVPYVRRRRSDTIYTENQTPLARLIRSEMEAFARYRCLTLVTKVPSNKLHSKYYTARPYLLAYTKWLASQGIYRSTSILLTGPKRASIMAGDGRRGSLLLGRRGSLLPTDSSRRASLTPSSRSAPAIAGGSSRRGSLTPSQRSAGSSKRPSVVLELGGAGSSSDEEEEHGPQLAAARGRARKDAKRSLFSKLFGCVSSRRSKKIERDLQRLEMLYGTAQPAH